MQTIKPVKFEITAENRIVATFSDGHQTIWTDCKTPKGAKARLTFWAKRYGFSKRPDGLMAMSDDK